MNHFIEKKVEPFCVQAYHNGEFKEITEKNLLGKWSIFFFYPAEITFLYPMVLQDYVDHSEDFQMFASEFYSLFTDSHFVHKAWADASDTIDKIRYPMLSDCAWSLSN